MFSLNGRGARRLLELSLLLEQARREAERLKATSREISEKTDGVEKAADVCRKKRRVVTGVT